MSDMDVKMKDEDRGSIHESSIHWKIHTPNLLDEILNGNEGMGIMTVPLQVLANLLGQTAQVASRINDPELNALMCRLTLYAISDPIAVDDYDPERCREIYELANRAKLERDGDRL